MVRCWNDRRGENKEKLAGVLLMASAVVVLLLANCPAAEAYRHFLHLHVGPSLPGLGVPSVHEGHLGMVLKMQA
jgi:Na+/H+ antiporter NhaA